MIVRPPHVMLFLVLENISYFSAGLFLLSGKFDIAVMLMASAIYFKLEVIQRTARENKS